MTDDERMERREKSSSRKGSEPGRKSGSKPGGGNEDAGSKNDSRHREKRPAPTTISDGMVILSAVVLSLFWGLAFVWIKMALDDLSPLELTVWRFMVASALYVPILLIKRAEVAKLSREDLPGLAIIGFVGMAGYHFLLNWGEQYTYSGTASLIIATIPIMVVIASTRLLGEKLTAGKVVGLALALTGVVVLSVQAGIFSGEGTQTALGVAAVLGSALTGMIYTVGGKRYMERYDPLVFVALGTLISLALLSPVLLLEGVTNPFDVSLRTQLAVLALGGLSTVVSYGLFFTILKHREASRTSMYVYLVPVFAVAFGVLLLGEHIGMLTLIGAGLVLVGVWVVNRRV